jgi:hypothetical protein
MMKLRMLMTGVLVAVTVSATAAQAQNCAAGQTQDACQKAVDLVNFITPQLSTALAGGNATLGQGGALGGLGHWELDIRASAVNGQLPKVNNVGLSTTGAAQTTFTTTSQFMPGVSANAAIGLWRGVSVGVTHIGGVDALLTATYLPNVDGGDVKFTVNGSNTKFGFGVRVGLLEESAITPGVGFTYLQRDLPTVNVTTSSTVSASGNTAPGDIGINSLSMKTTAWRIAASKNFLIFGLNAGLGQDKYSSSSNLAVTVRPSGSAPVSASTTAGFDMTRTNIFVGASIDLFIAKLVGEVGQVSGGSAPSATNKFTGGDASSSHSYFTLGLRFGM